VHSEAVRTDLRGGTSFAQNRRVNITHGVTPAIKCPKCKTADVNATPLTPVFLYVRCRSCGYQWNESTVAGSPSQVMAPGPRTAVPVNADLLIHDALYFR
jgi:hypothetical protein